MRVLISRLVTGSIFVVGLMAVVWLTGSLSGRALSQTGVPGLDPNSAQGGIPSALPVEKVATEQDPNAAAEASAAEAGAVMDPELVNSASINADGFVYDPTGKRDPFLPYQMAQPVQPTMGTAVPGRLEPTVIDTDPLRAHDLSQYRVVGILWDVDHPRAVIRTPGGKNVTIKKQANLGRNNGFVAQIREGEIVVVEPTIENGLPVAIARVLELTR